MKNSLLLLILLFTIHAYAEEEEETITYKIKGEEVTVKASENPELAKFVNQIKAAAEKKKAMEEGTDKPAEPEAVQETARAEPEKPSLNASPQSAEELYNKGDFEAAYDHYKELSAKGDSEASLMLAIMSSKGQGVEADEVAANAWFTRSAEQGNDSAEEFIKGTRLTDAEEEESRAYYNEIAREFDEPEKAEKANEQYLQVKRSSYQPQQPRTVDRTDQSKLVVKPYKQQTAGVYKQEPAKTYKQAPAKSYGDDRFEIKKY